MKEVKNVESMDELTIRQQIRFCRRRRCYECPRWDRNCTLRGTPKMCGESYHSPLDPFSHHRDVRANALCQRIREEHRDRMAELQALSDQLDELLKQKQTD